MSLETGNEPKEDADSDTGEENEIAVSSWSGSGVWERVENRKWEVVVNHVIPRMDRSLGCASLAPDLGISDYLQNFETESSLSDQNFRILTYGSTVIRVSENAHTDDRTDVELEPSQDEDPIPGPSGLQTNQGQSSSPARVPEEDTSSNQQASTSNRNKSKRFVRNKRNRRRRKKHRRQGLAQMCGGRRAGVLVISSAESSPGRRTPSPETLAQICLYWKKHLASPEYVIDSD